MFKESVTSGAKVPEQTDKDLVVFNLFPLIFLCFFHIVYANKAVYNLI